MRTTYRILLWEGLVLLIFSLFTIFSKGFEFISYWERQDAAGMDAQPFEFILLFPFVGAGLGLLLVVVGFVLYLTHLSKTAPESEVGEGSFKQTTRFGFNAILSSAIVLAILVLANIVANGRAMKWDLTGAHVNTLSEQSRTVLDNLPVNAEVEIIGFLQLDNKAYVETFEELTALYSDYDGRVRTRLIDPLLDRSAAEQYGIRTIPSILATCRIPDLTEEEAAQLPGCRGDAQFADDLSEPAFTAAILKAGSAPAGSIYFLSDHGVPALDDETAAGYSTARQLLEVANLPIKSLSLTHGEPPSDMRLLIIAGQRNALTPPEAERVDRFLEQGGRLLLLVDPETDHGLDEVLAKNGLMINNDYVIDEARGYRTKDRTYKEIPEVQDYTKHEILRDFQNYKSLFPLVRSLTLGESSPTAMAVPLVISGPDSLAIGIETKQFNQGQHILGAAAERQPAENIKSRVVVFGDADFIRNRWIHDPVAEVNNALFVNAVLWLMERSEYITTPNAFEAQTIALTSRDNVKIFYLSIFLLPQLIFMYGIWIAIRRRS